MKNVYSLGNVTAILRVPRPRGEAGGELEVAIDQADFERVAAIPGYWRAYAYKGQYYVRSDHASGRVMLHRLIAKPGPGERTVHRDGNGLNNTGANLVNALDVNKLPAPKPVQPCPKRPVATKSGITGVTWHKPSSRWAATLFHGGKRYCLGYHATIDEAAQAINDKKNELGVL